jgi:catechol 2,3-dioxygenase-like lactoylglutathione lyase family enzyme
MPNETIGPRTGSLNHIDITVGYPERSIPFYDVFFRALGYKRWKLEDPDWDWARPQRATWSIRQADGGIFAVEARPAALESRDQRYDRYAPGPHHLAFNAESNEVVDRVHDAMLGVGAIVLDPPTDYGREHGYSAGYYAVFFADPDNLKLEVAHIPLTKA